MTLGENEKLVRAIREQIRPPRVPGLGTVLAVMTAKGGVGATTIATNLAGVLARRGNRVCLVDLDFAMGDVLAFLDLTGGSAISDVIANIRRLDRELLDSSLLRHASGVQVLAQTDKVHDASSIEPAGLVSLIELLRQHYQAILIDGLRTFDDQAVAVLDACDRVLLVVTQEVPAVRRAQRCVTFLRRLGIADSNVHLVVNRYSRSSEVRKELISETVGLPVSATIGNDYPGLVRTINHGKLLVDSSPRSSIAKDYEALDALVGLRQAEKRSHSLLKRIFLNKAAGRAS
jgi:pilus assembly protein CpaE